jgi:hypothetical protein
MSDERAAVLDATPVYQELLRHLADCLAIQKQLEERIAATKSLVDTLIRTPKQGANDSHGV